MDRLINPGLFLGFFIGCCAGLIFGLRPHSHLGWLLAIGIVSAVAGAILGLLAAMLAAKRPASPSAGAEFGALSLMAWVVVVVAVPIGVAAAGVWLAGGDLSQDGAPPGDATDSIWGGVWRIFTWAGFAIGALLAGSLLVGAGMTLFDKSREQPRLAVARRLAAEGKLDQALAVCERAVSRKSVDGYSAKSDAYREMARLAVVLLHRLGRADDARSRYSAIERDSWNREAALLAEEIGGKDRALEIWETLSKRGEMREEDRPHLERLRSRSNAGEHR